MHEGRLGAPVRVPLDGDSTELTRVRELSKESEALPEERSAPRALDRAMEEIDRRLAVTIRKRRLPATLFGGERAAEATPIAIARGGGPPMD